MDLRGIGCEDSDWAKLAQLGSQSPAVMKTVLSLRDPKKRGTP